jgi:ABC-2 type transport system ATP-binding protein
MRSAGGAGTGLEISGLSHRFGNRVAVDHLDTAVGPGEIVGLVGRNGAGKTTTMRSVMGIVKPLSGQVRWHGRAAGQAERLRFGYMPEERGLYPQMRVAEQVAYFAELHGVPRPAAMARAGDWLGRLGLAGRGHDKVIALSHGNQQRVQFAIALAHDPDLLVLDEPFAGLDPGAVDAMSGIVRAAAARGAAVLFSSHQLDLVERLCHRVVILDEGRVLAAGTLAELRARAAPRLRVQVDGGPPGWAGRLPGAKVLGEDATGVMLLLEPDTDPQAVLRAAQAAGPVEHFGYEQAGLVEVYRELAAR